MDGEPVTERAFGAHGGGQEVVIYSRLEKKPAVSFCCRALVSVLMNSLILEI